MPPPIMAMSTLSSKSEVCGLSCLILSSIDEVLIEILECLRCRLRLRAVRRPIRDITATVCSDVNSMNN